MIVMGLDTTGSACSVSIVDNAVVLAHVAKDIGRGHAELLASMVAEALKAANLKPHDIDRLAVCSGPGNFTGLRVALSFAKGFALPRNLPVIGLNALEVAASEHWIMDETEEVISVYRDIRRGEAFYCAYQKGEPLMAPQSMPFDTAVAKSSEVGLGIETFATDTRILAWMAMACDPEDYPAEPLYSRGPDAKLPGGKSPKKTQMRKSQKKTT